MALRGQGQLSAVHGWNHSAPCLWCATSRYIMSTPIVSKQCQSKSFNEAESTPTVMFPQRHYSCCSPWKWEMNTDCSDWTKVSKWCVELSAIYEKRQTVEMQPMQAIIWNELNTFVWSTRCITMIVSVWSFCPLYDVLSVLMLTLAVACFHLCDLFSANTVRCRMNVIHKYGCCFFFWPTTVERRDLEM